jgi:hypothetical protein
MVCPMYIAMPAIWCNKIHDHIQVHRARNSTLTIHRPFAVTIDIAHPCEIHDPTRKCCPAFILCARYPRWVLNRPLDLL